MARQPPMQARSVASPDAPSRAAAPFPPASSSSSFALDAKEDAAWAARKSSLGPARAEIEAEILAAAGRSAAALSKEEEAAVAAREARRMRICHERLYRDAIRSQLPRELVRVNSLRPSDAPVASPLARRRGATYARDAAAAARRSTSRGVEEALHVQHSRMSKWALGDYTQGAGTTRLARAASHRGAWKRLELQGGREKAARPRTAVGARTAPMIGSVSTGALLGAAEAP